MRRKRSLIRFVNQFGLSRHRVLFCVTFLTIINFFFGAVILQYGAALFGFTENQLNSSDSENSVGFGRILHRLFWTQSREEQKFRKTVRYDYYFRLDYLIEQASCEPVSIFNTNDSINSIQTMTVEILNGIFNEKVTIESNILRIISTIHPFVGNKQIELYKKNQLLCDYTLELFVEINFPSSCRSQCQSMELEKITSNRTLFNELLKSSSSEQLVLNINSPKMPIAYHIHNIDIHQTIKYFEQSVNIQSVFENRYVLIDFPYSNISQPSISLSVKDKSSFIMKSGLYPLDSSSIYVSFLLSTSTDLYLRHEMGLVTLAKDDHSTLFRQDSTFKLIFNDQNNIVAFQIINFSDKYCVGLDDGRIIGLIVDKCDGLPNLGRLDINCLFKLITA